MAYPYQSLSTPNEIRLLILDPSSAGPKITCQLVHSELELRLYEAVSYEWGLPSEEDPEITIDNHVIVIRRNLYFALQQFRHENEERILWIDAICINQNDAEEKGRQVQFMGNIYNKADMVLVWLGLEESDTYLAYHCLHRVAALMPGVDTKVKLEEVQESDAFVANMGYVEDKTYILKPVTLSKRELAALRTLMEKPYWYRGWVVQEIFLATRFSLNCGKQCISSNILVPVCDTLNVLHYPPWDRSQMAFHYMRTMQGTHIIQLRTWRSYRPRPDRPNGLLLYTMSICDKSKCTEVRDYVYAFAALDRFCGIVVDYNISLEQLLKQIRRIERNTADSAFYRRRRGDVTKSLRRKLLGEQNKYQEALRSMRNILEHWLFEPRYRMQRWMDDRKKTDQKKENG
jgi:hypothetical protein